MDHVRECADLLEAVSRNERAMKKRVIFACAPALWCWRSSSSLCSQGEKNSDGVAAFMTTFYKLVCALSLILRCTTFLSAQTYTVPGHTHTTAGGAVTDVPVKGLNTVKKCHQFAGANASAKIAACIAALPSTGGVADA